MLLRPGALLGKDLGVDSVWARAEAHQGSAGGGPELGRGGLSGGRAGVRKARAKTNAGAASAEASARRGVCVRVSDQSRLPAGHPRTRRVANYSPDFGPLEDKHTPVDL